MYSDHKQEISVQPHHIKGGLDTIVQLAKLFDINLCAQDFGKPILFCIESLTEEEKQVLKDLVKEYSK